jgi:hypothetical protein
MYGKLYVHIAYHTYTLYTSKHTYTNICINTYVDIRKRTHTYLYTLLTQTNYTCVHIYTHTYMYTCVVYTLVHSHTHTYVYITYT